MEHLELLINRALLLFFIAFFGCTPNESVLMIHEGSNDLDLFKINVTYRGKVYSGMVYNTNNIGDTISIGEYKNGLKNGLWKKFYSNGKLKEKRSFKNGLKVGLYEGFYSNGAKNFVFNFKNGEYNGTNRLWAKNGQILRRLIMLMDWKRARKKVGILMEG